MKSIKQIIFIGVSFSIVIFLIYFFFSGSIEPGENFFSINRFFFWSLGYIVCFVIGICFRFYEDGNELTEKEKSTYQMMDTITNMPVFKTYIDIIQM